MQFKQQRDAERTRVPSYVYDEMFKDVKPGDEIKIFGIKQYYKIKAAMTDYIKRNGKKFVSTGKRYNTYYMIYIKSADEKLSVL